MALKQTKAGPRSSRTPVLVMTGLRQYTIKFILSEFVFYSEEREVMCAGNG